MIKLRVSGPRTRGFRESSARDRGTCTFFACQGLFKPCASSTCYKVKCRDFRPLDNFSEDCLWVIPMRPAFRFVKDMIPLNLPALCRIAR